jgi:hypothetical protein
MTLPLLTQFRRAVRDSIDNWDNLRDVFARKWYFENKNQLQSPEPEPSLSEMPAIHIGAGTVATPWVTNQGQDLTGTVSITIWTPQLYLPSMELIYQEIQRALWQAKPDDTDARTYLARVTDNTIEQSAVQVQAVLTESRAQAIRASWSITVKLAWNPRLDDSVLEITN